MINRTVKYGNRDLSDKLNLFDVDYSAFKNGKQRSEKSTCESVTRCPVWQNENNIGEYFMACVCIQCNFQIL